MDRFLNNIRKPAKSIPISKQLLVTLIFLILGACSGTLTRFIDSVYTTVIPAFLRPNTTSFLYRFAFWILVTVAISVFSKSPVRAGINVFGFYAGMLLGYYFTNATVYGLTSGFGGLTSWALFAVLSPFAAFLCWYARGDGVVAYILAAFIVAVMFYLAFSYGWLFFAARNIIEVVLWIGTIAVLYRNPKQILSVLLISLAFAVIFYFLPPSFLC